MAHLPPLPGAHERWAFFLDIDGTLLTIAATPRAVHVEEALLTLLKRLQKLSDGALAVISGRTLTDIDALFTPLRLPAAGLHGLERRRADGVIVNAGAAEDGVAPLRPALAAFAAAHPGVLLEDKGKSIALHYRQAPGCGLALRRFARRLAAGAGPQLRVIEGRKVVELQPGASDKGRAIATFLEEPPFAGRRPFFAGDDRTDEDGFLAVNRLGGISLKVAARENRAAATAAHYLLPSVAALQDWLRAVAAALDRSSPSEAPGGTGAAPPVLS